MIPNYYQRIAIGSKKIAIIFSHSKNFPYLCTRYKQEITKLWDRQLQGGLLL